MKKLVALMLMVVLMLAIAVPALADNVGYNFTVTTTRGQQKRTSFGVKDTETNSAAQVTLYSCPQVEAGTRLYFVMVAMDGSDASYESCFTSVRTLPRSYKPGYGIKGDGYKVGFWKNTSVDPDCVVRGNFTP